MDEQESAPGADNSGERSVESSSGNAGRERDGTRSVSQGRRARDIREWIDWMISPRGPHARPGDKVKTNTLRVIGVALTKRMNSNTLVTFASALYTAELIGLTERTVSAGLAILRRDGWIQEWLEPRGRTMLRNRLPVIPASAEADQREKSSGREAGAEAENFSGARRPKPAKISGRHCPRPEKYSSTTRKTLQSEAEKFSGDLLRDLITDLRGASSPQPADTGSAGPEYGAVIRDLLLKGFSPERIVQFMPFKGVVTVQQVLRIRNEAGMGP